jgi:hypothetical protein
MLLEKFMLSAKVLALGVLIVIGILSLSYDQAYGSTTSTLQFTLPGYSVEYLAVSKQISSNAATSNWIFDCYPTDPIDEPPSNIPAVPEPATLILLGIGLAGITLLRQRD